MGRARWVIWALGAAGVLGCGGGSGGAPKGPVCEPSAAPLASVPAGGLVQTKDGPVQGIDAGDVFTYFGIPYAEPPVGPLRWKPPVPRAPWTDTLETIAPEAPPIPLAPAIIPVPKCPQALDIAGPFASFLGPISEDCLYLNVVTPKAGKGLPVMVWIHGGGFVFGEGVQTDGGTAGNLLAAQQDVIVVSMNYRLGALGFAAHPGLSAESADGVSGNYGLMDQAAALRWVKDNIAQFGGDPNNVTVFGESAGAFSICGLMASPKAACLFDKAILESGSCERPWATLASAEAQGETLADKLGCAGPKGSDPSPAGEVACMRTKTPKELMDAWPIAGSFGVGLTAAAEDAPQWWPTLDGDFFPEQPAAAFSSGDYMQVPTLLGFNQHEGRLFVWLTEDPTVGDGVAITAENYPSFLARGEQTGAVGERRGDDRGLRAGKDAGHIAQRRLAGRTDDRRKPRQAFGKARFRVRPVGARGDDFQPDLADVGRGHVAGMGAVAGIAQQTVEAGDMLVEGLEHGAVALDLGKDLRHFEDHVLLVGLEAERRGAGGGTGATDLRAAEQRIADRQAGFHADRLAVLGGAAGTGIGLVLPVDGPGGADARPDPGPGLGDFAVGNRNGLPCGLDGRIAFDDGGFVLEIGGVGIAGIVTIGRRIVGQ